MKTVYAENVWVHNCPECQSENRINDYEFNNSTKIVFCEECGYEYEIFKRWDT